MSKLDIIYEFMEHDKKIAKICKQICDQHLALSKEKVSLVHTLMNMLRFGDVKELKQVSYQEVEFALDNFKGG